MSTEVTNALISRAEAKSRGLKRYCTGKPCPQGHVAAKLTSNGGCVACSKARFEIYCRANPEKFRAYQRKEREANPAKVRAYARAWYAVNREKARAWNRAWAAANVSKKRLLDTVHNAKRRALKQKQRCVCCSDSAFLNFYDTDWIGSKESGLDTLHVDHIVQLALGGAHCTKNLQVISEAEHKRKNWADARQRADFHLRARLLKAWAAPLEAEITEEQPLPGLLESRREDGQRKAA
jgi:5-methylcytosine-specific restriction endonuclease McrA